MEADEIKKLNTMLHEEYSPAAKTVTRFFVGLAKLDPAFGAVAANWLTTLESLREISRLRVGETTGKLTG